MVKSRDKKRLKIPKGQSESVYRRIENTMVKRKKIQKDKQRSTKHTKYILIQQELSFIEKDRTNIRKGQEHLL
jgi:hypothetical protein